MDFETLDRLRQSHPAWRLLRADYAALIASFLQRIYVKPNVRSLPESELVLKLEDYLFHLRRDLGGTGSRGRPAPTSARLVAQILRPR